MVFLECSKQSRVQNITQTRAASFLFHDNRESDAASSEKVTAECKQDVTIKLPEVIEIWAASSALLRNKLPPISIFIVSVYEGHLFSLEAFQMGSFFERKKNSLVYFPMVETFKKATVPGSLGD